MGRMASMTPMRCPTGSRGLGVRVMALGEGEGYCRARWLRAAQDAIGHMRACHFECKWPGIFLMILWAVWCAQCCRVTKAEYYRIDCIRDGCTECMGWGKKCPPQEWFTAGWEWEPNIETPDLERLPLPPSSIVQRHFANWYDDNLSRVVPDLRGSTILFRVQKMPLLYKKTGPWPYILCSKLQVVSLPSNNKMQVAMALHFTNSAKLDHKRHYTQNWVQTHPDGSPLSQSNSW